MGRLFQCHRRREGELGSKRFMFELQRFHNKLVGFLFFSFVELVRKATEPICMLK